MPAGAATHAAAPATLYTVGHGERRQAALLALLQAAGVGLLVDVRARPGSRRNPQFNREVLARALERAGIGYTWQGRALGGLRREAPAGADPALPEPALRAFAAHMRGGEFAHAIAGLLAQTRRSRVALMCAERDPARCHRSLIADYLLARGARVLHLIDPGESRVHRVDPSARPSGDGLFYDRNTQAALELPTPDPARGGSRAE